MAYGMSDLSSAFQRVHGVYVPDNVAQAIGQAPKKHTISETSAHPDWDFDPVNFKVFCESKDHMKMLPSDWKASDEDGALSKKQYDDCMAILGDDPLKMFDPEVRKYTFGGLLWAKGCISGETLIFDEGTQQAYTVKEIIDRKLPITVKSYNEKNNKVVVKKVTRLFSKGTANRLKFVFKSGSSIVVAPEHRFHMGASYTDLGSWLPARNMVIGEEYMNGRVGRLVDGKLLFDPIISITKETDGEIFDLTVDEETPNYFTADGLLHHNSGKDLVCSLLQAYVVHILLCLKNPQDFFGFAPGEPCDILNVGKKGMQAERVYFTKFRARLLKWEWMLKKFNVTDEGKRFRYNGKTFPYCKIGTRSAEWPYKNIRAFAENSGDPGSFEGYNIVFFICDEISAWVSESERRLAEKILDTLRTSQSSRNTKKLAGLGLAISFPRQDDDIMFELEKESKLPGSKIFFSRGYQWDVKPKRFYSGKTFEFNAGTIELPEMFQIPTELDEDFFRKHPEQAKCFYLLRPPAVGGPFFEFTDKLDSMAYKDRQSLFKVDTSYIDAVDGKGNKIVYVRKKIVGINRPPSKNVDYVAWMDAADTMCDAVLSVGHLEAVTMIEGSEKNEVVAVVLDDVIVWEPDPTMRRIVDIGSMTTCCIDMLKYISLKIAWWDQWNSGTGMFDLRKAGIMCDKHNLIGADYEFFKGIIYSNRFIAPVCPHVLKGIEQVKHLSRTRTNNVTPGSSKHKKDISDTWCGITVLLLGSLAPNTGLRAGRAPSSISLGQSAGGSVGVTGGSQGNTNPFNQGNTPRGGVATRDHSDLFRMLSPMAGGGGLGQMQARPRTTQVQRQPGQQTRQAFPRGLKL